MAWRTGYHQERGRSRPALRQNDGRIMTVLTIPPGIRAQLRAQLMGEEDVKLHPYVDSSGNLSIGIGRNLVTTGISMEEALHMLDNDIMRCQADLWHYAPWYADLDNIRKMVIIDMVFNLGIQGVLGFKRMIAAIRAEDYVGAAREMLASHWATQVGKRAARLATQMETGVI